MTQFSLIMNIHRNILKISLPLVLSNISIPLSGLFNTMLLGHVSSSQYIAAQALGNTILLLIIWLFNFIRISTTGFIAQAFSRNNWQDIGAWMTNIFLFGIIVSIIVITCQKPLLWFFFLCIPHASDILPITAQYYKIAIFITPFVLMWDKKNQKSP